MHLPTMLVDAGSNPSQSGASQTNYNGAVLDSSEVRDMTTQRPHTKSCTGKPHSPDLKTCTSS